MGTKQSSESIFNPSQAHSEATADSSAEDVSIKELLEALDSDQQVQLQSILDLITSDRIMDLLRFLQSVDLSKVLEVIQLINSLLSRFRSEEIEGAGGLAALTAESKKLRANLRGIGGIREILKYKDEIKKIIECLGSMQD